MSQDRKTALTLDEARGLLEGCERQQLGDRETRAFEVYWSKGGQEVASGWFDGLKDSVWFAAAQCNFDGDDARALRYTGKSIRTEFMQPSPEEEEAASLQRWAQLAHDYPYNPATGGGVLIDIGGELYSG
jgi:hypothetical protein